MFLNLSVLTPKTCVHGHTLPAPSAVRLLSARSSTRQPVSSWPVQDLADDLDIIDSLFHDALTTHNDGSRTNTAADAPNMQHEQSTAVAQQSSAVRRPPTLPKRARQLPWASSGGTASQGQQPTAIHDAIDQPGLSAVRKPRAAFAAANSLSKQSRTAKNTLRPQRLSLDKFEGKQIEQSIGQTLADDQQTSRRSPPVNPWLLRQQQQQQQQRQKRKLLAKQKAALAAATAETGRQQRYFVQLQAEQQQRMQQHTQQQQQPLHVQEASNVAQQQVSSAQLFVGQQQQKSQLLQQQQQGVQGLPHQQQHVQQQQHLDEQRNSKQLQQAQQEPFTYEPSGSDSGTEASQQQQGELMQLETMQQQQQPLRLQQQLQLEAGIVRSSRRLHRQQTASRTAQQPQPMQQSTVSISTAAGANSGLPAATAAAATAAVPSDIGRAPLVVLGAQAAGSQVVWQQQQHWQGQQQGSSGSNTGFEEVTRSQQAYAAITHSTSVAQQQQDASTPGQPVTSSCQQNLTIDSNNTSSSSSIVQSNVAAEVPLQRGPAARSVAAAGAARPAAAAVKSRYRRGSSLQGVASGAPPGEPPGLEAGVGAAAAPAAVPTAAADGVVVPVAASGIDSSSGSSTGSGTEREVQLQLDTLDVVNWQMLAKRLLPGTYDPSWHSSLYTLMLDVWPAAFAFGKATVTSSAATARDSAANAVPLAAATAWGVACLYHSQRYMWSSALLALIDSLAQDDVLLAGKAVHVLPADLAEKLVLPAAAVLDDGVHAALKQELDRQKAKESGAAVQSLIGPAPWTIKQQQQQSSENVDSQKSDPCRTGATSSSTPAAVTDCAAIAAEVQKVVPGAEQVLDMLQDLQQLQGLYPGVELGSLAHVAQSHGLFSD